MFVKKKEKLLSKDNFIKLIQSTDHFMIKDKEYIVKRKGNVCIVNIKDMPAQHRDFCIYDMKNDMMYLSGGLGFYEKCGIELDKDKVRNICSLEYEIVREINDIIKSRVIEEGMYFEQDYLTYKLLIDLYVSGIERSEYAWIGLEKKEIVIDYLNDPGKTVNDFINGFVNDEDRLAEYINNLQEDLAENMFLDYIKEHTPSYIMERKKIFDLVDQLDSTNKVEITCILVNERRWLKRNETTFELSVSDLFRCIENGYFDFKILEDNGIIDPALLNKKKDECYADRYAGSVNNIRYIKKDGKIIYEGKHIGYDDTLVKNDFSRDPKFVPQSELDMIREIYSAILK